MQTPIQTRVILTHEKVYGTKLLQPSPVSTVDPCNKVSPKPRESYHLNLTTDIHSMGKVISFAHLQAGVAQEVAIIVPGYYFSFIRMKQCWDA